MFNILRDDIKAVFDRDPAATSYLEVIFTYSGLHALLAHRFAHWMWARSIPLLPRAISQLTRLLTGIEIHPGDVGLEADAEAKPHAAAPGLSAASPAPRRGGGRPRRRCSAPPRG